MQRKKTKNFIIILASLFVIFLMINTATAVKISNSDNIENLTVEKTKEKTIDTKNQLLRTFENINPNVLEEIISDLIQGDLKLEEILPNVKNTDENDTQPLWHPDLGCPWILFIPITLIWIGITAVSIPTGIYIPMFLITWIASIIEEYNADNWYQFGVPFLMGLSWPIIGWMMSVSLAYEICCDIYENTHGI